MNVMHGKRLAHLEIDDRQIPGDVGDANRALLRRAGDDPLREGLIDTPARVDPALREYRSRYWQDPSNHLHKTFGEVSSYDGMAVLRDIPLHFHREHHLAPIVGTASMAGISAEGVVCISKPVGLIKGCSRRLQFHVRLTTQVAQCIWDNLKRKGATVLFNASRGRTTGRGLLTHGFEMATSYVLGCFREDASSRKEVSTLMTRA